MGPSLLPRLTTAAPKMPPRRRAAVSPKPTRPTPVTAHEKTKDKDKKTEYEFGGPVGAALTMATMPLVVYGLFFACNADLCVRGPSTAAAALAQARSSIAATTFWSWEAAAVVLGWFVLQALLFLWLPGPMVPGAALQDGSRLTYPMNGHLAFWISLGLACLGLPVLGADGGLVALQPLPLAWCYDHYAEQRVESAVLVVHSSSHRSPRAGSAGYWLRLHSGGAPQPPRPRRQHVVPSARCSQPVPQSPILRLSTEPRSSWRARRSCSRWRSPSAATRLPSGPGACSPGAATRATPCTTSSSVGPA